MLKVLRTAEYGRVSSEEQAKYGFSIQNQIDRLDKYVEENDLMLVDRFIDDGYSAGSTNRPELQRLLANLDKIDLIIFTKLDRFTRNVLDANEMVKLFEKHNVSIKAIDEEDVDTSTADGMFMFNLKVSLAQRELKKGSERITTVFDYKVKQGQPITGSQPYGYTIETLENGIKKVIKDKEAEPIVNEIFEHFLTHQSIRGTMDYINEKYNLDFSYRKYNRILKETRFFGLYRGNPDYCPAYITKETFDKIQHLISKNIKVRKNKHTYLFSGLIRCPKCNRKMSGLYKKNRYDKVYYYYRCSGQVDHKCNIKNIREDLIEEFLLQNINRLIQEYICEVNVEIDNKPKPKIDIKEITDEMDNLNYMFRKKRISQKEYDYEYELLEKKLAEAEREMPKEADLSGLQAFLNSGWSNVYKNLEKAEQRALFRSVIEEINIDENGVISVVFISCV